jgi:hypothetical protein
MILNSKNNINGLNILYKKDPADISTFADEKFY